jgi:hypothetical protein
MTESFKKFFPTLLLLLPIEFFPLIAAKHSASLPPISLLASFLALTFLPFNKSYFIPFSCISALNLLYLVILYFSGYELWAPLRQTIAFTIGFLFFLTCLKYINRQNIQKCLSIINLTFLIIVPFSLLTLQLDPFRLKSTFTEPAHFGDYIALVLLPCLFIQYKIMNRKYFYGLILLATILLILTFSTLSIARLIILLTSFMILFFNWKLFAGFLFFLSGIFSLFFILPENHVQYGLERVYEVIQSRSLSYNFPSLVDRVYPVIYSVKTLMKGYVFGLGPGSDWLFRTTVFDEVFLNTVLPYKSSTSIMNSFMGKMILYWGILPLLFLGFWLKRIFKKADLSCFQDRCFLAIISSTIMNSFFGIGNFTFPYFWFWIGISTVYFFKKPMYTFGKTTGKQKKY